MVTLNGCFNLVAFQIQGMGKEVSSGEKNDLLGSVPVFKFCNQIFHTVDQVLSTVLPTCGTVPVSHSG